MLKERVRLDDNLPSSASLTQKLVEQYYFYIYRLCLSIIHDESEAEDITQDTFVVALVKIDKCDPNSNLKAWLSTIAVNKCRDRLRKHQTKQRLLTEWNRLKLLVGGHPTPEEEVTRIETNQQLWEAVEKLKEKHRLPIILRYVHNLPIKEIAQILETKEGTIHSRLYYACQQLNQRFASGSHVEQVLQEKMR